MVGVHRRERERERERERYHVTRKNVREKKGQSCCL
jgi:hypothetical protein